LFPYSSSDNKTFEIYGSLEYRPVIGTNTAGGHGYGPMIVEFKSEAGSHKIEIWSPLTEVGGLLFGERTFNFYDTLYVKDPENSLYAEIVF
jgi:hypothetical protein